MIDEQHCRYCTEKKVKRLLRIKKGIFIYTDAAGKVWSGARCPECYLAYKKEYDIKRRLKKGHVAIGTILVCSVCQCHYEMENGNSNKICNDCKKSG